MLDMSALQTTLPNPTFIAILYATTLSFVLSLIIAMTYEKTFRGLSYSRNYVQSLILSPIVAATVIQAIGNSLATGLGMMGALAIIRFRTNLKDSRDIVFMFAVLAEGIACGVNGYSIAITGSLVFSMVAWFLYYSPFGKSKTFDGLLRFNLLTLSEETTLLESMLKKYCRVFALITLREMAQGKRLDYSYHIKLKQDKDKELLIKALRQIQSIQDVHLLLQETTVEL